MNHHSPGRSGRSSAVSVRRSLQGILSPRSSFIGLLPTSRTSLRSLAVPGQSTEPQGADEAGSETIAFLKSLDVLAHEGDKIQFDVRYACLQNWFARSSWHDKLHFIRSLLRKCEGNTLLLQLLISICSIGTKDALFLFSEKSGGSSCDRVLLDDNKDLDTQTLTDVRILDQIWFLGLEEPEQLDILLGLLVVGGGALTFRVYYEAYRMLAKRRKMNTYVSKSQIEEVIEDTDKEEKIYEKDNADLVSAGKGKKQKQKAKKGKKEKMKGKKDKKKEKEDSGNSDSGDQKIVKQSISTHPVQGLRALSEEEEDLYKKLATQKAIWQDQLDAIRKFTAGEDRTKNKGKDKKMDKKEKPGKKDKKWTKASKGFKGTEKEIKGENLDIIQMMPPSINKKIMKYLDPETLNEAKKVNSYWAAMIDSMQKDEVARQKINRDIEKMSNIRYPEHLYLPDKPWSKRDISTSRSDQMNSHSKRLANKFSTQVKSPHKNFSEFKTIFPARISQDGINLSSTAPFLFESGSILHQPSVPDKKIVNLQDHLVPLVSQSKILEVFDTSNLPMYDQYKKMFMDKHCIVRIVNSFLHLRVTACGSGNRLLAVTDEDHGIIFYSLITGAQLTPHLEGSGALITCMVFHPDGSYVITGSKDKKVRCWDIWSSQVVMTYLGHEDKINAISTSKEFVASGSEDKQLKVFHLRSGLCLATHQAEEAITALHFNDNSRLIYAGCKGGGIFVYNYSIHSVDCVIPAHALEVTDFSVSTKLVLSSSLDGLVKMWRIQRSELQFLHSFHHEKAVRTVCQMSSQVISGCNEGCIWVWDIMTGMLIRKFEVWSRMQPIFHLYCADERDHVKVVVSGEVGVTVYEFHPRQRQKIEKISKQDGKSENRFESIGKLQSSLKNTTICKDLGQSERVSRKTLRLNSLAMRGSVDNALRYPPNAPSTKKSFISGVCTTERRVFNPQTGTLTAFPRLAVKAEFYKLPTEVPNVDWNLSKPDSKSVHVQRNVFTHKNLLQLYNIHKISF